MPAFRTFSLICLALFCYAVCAAFEHHVEVAADKSHHSSECSLCLLDHTNKSVLSTALIELSLPVEQFFLVFQAEFVSSAPKAIIDLVARGPPLN